jgi:hypothetical protein
MGVSRDIIEHKLQVNPSVNPKKLKLQKMSKEKEKQQRLRSKDY